jgi:hypothetical protein
LVKIRKFPNIETIFSVKIEEECRLR